MSILLETIPDKQVSEVVFPSWEWNLHTTSQPGATLALLENGRHVMLSQHSNIDPAFHSPVVDILSRLTTVHQEMVRNVLALFSELVDERERALNSLEHEVTKEQFGAIKSIWRKACRESAAQCKAQSS